MILDRTMIEVHTTDRAAFRRCRRKWNWSSPIWHDLRPKDAPVAPLWFGTGIHFCLEDYHGPNLFGHPLYAWQAYLEAHRRSELPDDWEEHNILAEDMLSYYADYWEPRFLGGRYVTAKVDGKPLTEVHFDIELPYEWYSDVNPEVDAHYVGRIDRIVVDQYDRYWVVDYKTAARFDTSKLDIEPQATAYTWAASKALGLDIEGVIWIQLLKESPKAPRQLVNGEFSQAQNQKTSSVMYRDTLMKVYGEIPARYVEFLNWLISTETEWGDRYIRHDLLRRNKHWLFAEEDKIRDELRDMVNPGLPLYPNPTRDCAWDCPFKAPCLAMDDGSDYIFLLKENYHLMEEGDQWKGRIKWPTAGVTFAVSSSDTSTFRKEDSSQ